MWGNPHFSTRRNLLKKIWEKINIDIINWEKNLLDPLTTSNAIYNDPLILTVIDLIFSLSLDGSSFRF